jgi:hypothetical protein
MPKAMVKGAARLDRLVRGSKAKLTPDRARTYCHPDWVVAAQARPPAALWTPAIRTPTGLKPRPCGTSNKAGSAEKGDSHCDCPFFQTMNCWITKAAQLATRPSRKIR